MESVQAEYKGSFSKVDECPDPGLPEMAFIGRSNVGKSSLVNAICLQKNLAYISSNPGKTQSINFYLLNEVLYLVDLPGYGYARVSRTQRSAWEKMVRGYLEQRTSLFCVFQLVDASIPPQQADLDFTNWLGEQGLPVTLVFTKTDKRKKDKAAGAQAYLKKLSEFWEQLPPHLSTSSTTGAGVDLLRKYMQELLPV